MNAIHDVGIVVSESGDNEPVAPYHPGYLVARVWLSFSKKLLEDARTSPGALDLIAEDARKRLRALLNKIPEEVPSNEPQAD